MLSVVPKISNPIEDFSQVISLGKNQFKVAETYIFSLDLIFRSFLTFFAPWNRKNRDESFIKNSKEKSVKCATKVACLHKVSTQSCKQNRSSPKVQSRAGDCT